MKNRTFARHSLIDFAVGGIILVVTLLVFWFSPVHQVTDSKYSMFLSECLIRHRSFKLDNLAVPRLQPVQRTDYVMNGGIYQLEIVRDRIYYFFPPGSSVLSIPYVAAANQFGVAAANPDGSFNLLGEMTIQLGLAALLMSILSALFFFTSRLLLPLGWSVLIAVGASLGTQIWSTASRGLWSHTWSVLLAGVVVYLLLLVETRKNELHPILLATLLSWMYFVRPGNSIQVVCVTVFVAVCYRASLPKFLAAGLTWLLIFVGYSRYNFGQWLPNYYRASRLEFGIFPVAFPGNLISPSRGLLMYVPVVLFVTFLLIRYWRFAPARKLALLAIAVSVGNLLIVSCFVHWWGGAAFGARFMTDVVPWFVLLAVIAIGAMLNREGIHKHARVAWAGQLMAGFLLLAASIFINARGALAIETWRWNPGDVSELGNKLWDWRRPQFLAGLVTPPLEHDYPNLPLETRVNFSVAQDSNRYLWYGWSNPEPPMRWTDGKEASLVFSTDQSTDLVLSMKVLPFIREGVHNQQRVYFELNGKPIDSIVLRQNLDTDVAIKLHRLSLQPKNVLRLKLPDAASPELLKISEDQRQLGIAVYWIELHH